MSRSHTIELGSTATRILSLLAAGLALAVVSTWIYSSYFRFDVAGSLIWPGWDGYCVEGVQSLGVHCFSDFSQFLVLGESMDPEGSNPFIRNYPPINRTIFWVFQMLAVYVGYGFSVGLYVAVSAACLLVPVLWAVRGRSWTQQLLIVSLAGVATYPFLAAVDRGNNIAFAIPFVLLAVVGLQRDSGVLTLVGIVGASQIKPQFGALVIALVVLRRFRLAVIVVVTGIAVFLASFVLVLLSRPALSPLQEFKDFILYTRFYDQYLPLDSAYPPNASFAHLVALAQQSVGVSLLSETQLQYVVASVVGVFVVVVMWRGNRLPVGLWFPAVLMAISLTPAISFAYYLAGALVIVALALREPFASEIDSGPKPLVILLTAAIVVSLTPLLIPLGGAEAPVPVLGEGVTISLLPRVAAVLWAAYLVAVAVVSARRSAPAISVTDG
jgi:hypothetical protein